MAENNTLTSANGWFKPRFGKIIDARPNGVKTLPRVPFQASKKLGKEYSEVAWLGHEHGFTYDSGTGTAFDLNAAEAAVSKELTASGAEIVLRTRSSYKMLSAAVAGGEAAFGKSYGRIVANMKQSFARRLEIATLWGGLPMGTATTVAGSGTTRTVTISDETWAIGIWAGLKNAKIDCYNSATKQNTEGDLTITSIDIADKAFIISGTANDVAAVDTADTSADFYFKGAYGNEAVGIVSACGNSGTYLGIDGSSSGFELWAGNNKAVGSANLTWATVQAGLEEAVGKGLDGDVVLQCSIPTWSDLNSDVNALRTIDAGYKSTVTEVGTSSLTYHTLAGKVTVEPTPCMKEGEAIIFPTMSGEVIRVGSTDVSFELPDHGGEFFRHLQDNAGVELRAYSDQVPIVRCPAKCVRFTGISNG